MQVGTTKDQGLYNKPSAAVHRGALAAVTLPRYNTIQQYSKLILVHLSFLAIKRCCDLQSTVSLEMVGNVYVSTYSKVFGGYRDIHICPSVNVFLQNLIIFTYRQVLSFRKKNMPGLAS